MPAEKRATPHPMERTEEFDAFGPWVLPVTTADEVPRLFRPHAGDPTTAQAMIKVPRKISRRDANPSMDLYEHLLVVRDGTVVLLTRTPSQTGGVHQRSVALDRLVGLEESVDLLDGRLVLHPADGPVLRVSFNGASRDTVEALVAVVRQRWQQGAGHAAPERDPHPVPLGLRDLGPDVALVTEYRALIAAEPGMRLLGAHPRRVVRPGAEGGAVSAGGLTRFLHSLWPMHLQGAVVCSDGRELVVIHRRPWWTRGSRPVNSLARTIVPIDRAGPLVVVDHPEYDNVLLARLAGGVVEFPMPVGSPSEVALREALA